MCNNLIRIYQGEVDAQTIEEYLDLEKRIANAETLRYILTSISTHFQIFSSIFQMQIGADKF